jgi:hypothetical protein
VVHRGSAGRQVKVDFIGEYNEEGKASALSTSRTSRDRELHVNRGCIPCSKGVYVLEWNKGSP